MNKTTIDLSTLELLNDYFKSTDIKFDYNYGCSLRFYTNRQILNDEVYSNQYLPNIYLNEVYYGWRDGYIRQFNTVNQYHSGIAYWFKDFNHKHRYDKHKPIISFIEVFHNNEFIARHFVRGGEVIKVVSFEPRDKCPYIRNQIISDKPLLDWGKIFGNRLAANVDKTKNIAYYIKH